MVDRFQELLGPKARYLGREVGAPREVVEVFVDEVLLEVQNRLDGTGLTGRSCC